MTTTTVSVFPSLTTRPLAITASAFFSFATPAITVPYPSAYLQTQIPFVFTQTATFASTRIPTTIGGAAATSGISTADYAQGSTYGQAATSGGSGRRGGWPVWATAVIAACGGVALIGLIGGLWFWCTRGKRRARRRAKDLIRENNGEKVGKRKIRKGVMTEKHRGGGYDRRVLGKNPPQQKNFDRPQGLPDGIPPVSSETTLVDGQPLPVLPAAIATTNNSRRFKGRLPPNPYPQDRRDLDPYTTPPQSYNSQWIPNSTGRDSGFEPSGYASEGSPARLWNPSQQQPDSLGGTPRSSFNIDRGRMENDGLLVRNSGDSGGRLTSSLSLPPGASEFAPMPSRVRRSMDHERSRFYEGNDGGNLNRLQLEREFRERSKSSIREDLR